MVHMEVLIHCSLSSEGPNENLQWVNRKLPRTPLFNVGAEACSRKRGPVPTLKRGVWGIGPNSQCQCECELSRALGPLFLQVWFTSTLFSVDGLRSTFAVGEPCKGAGFWHVCRHHKNIEMEGVLIFRHTGNGGSKIGCNRTDFPGAFLQGSQARTFCESCCMGSSHIMSWQHDARPANEQYHQDLPCGQF